MAVQFTFRKMEATESLKTHISKKVNKFHKYVNYPIEIHVTLSVDKVEHFAEITCHAAHHNLVAHAKSENLYESIDRAVHKLETQLKKEREKRKGHSGANVSARASADALASDVDAVIPHKSKQRA